MNVPMNFRHASQPSLEPQTSNALRKPFKQKGTEQVNQEFDEELGREHRNIVALSLTAEKAGTFSRGALRAPPLRFPVYSKASFFPMLAYVTITRSRACQNRQTV